MPAKQRGGVTYVPPGIAASQLWTRAEQRQGVSLGEQRQPVLYATAGSVIHVHDLCAKQPLRSEPCRLFCACLMRFVLQTGSMSSAVLETEIGDVARSTKVSHACSCKRWTAEHGWMHTPMLKAVKTLEAFLNLICTMAYKSSLRL